MCNVFADRVLLIGEFKPQFLQIQLDHQNILRG